MDSDLSDRLCNAIQFLTYFQNLTDIEIMQLTSPKSKCQVNLSLGHA